MRILFLSWYDRKNPASGGAENLSLNILKRLVDKGHEVTWFSHRFKGSVKTEDQDGIKVVRRGNRVWVVFAAFFYYLKNFRSFDLVIDNFHAFSFLTCFYVKRSKRIAMIYEVAGRAIWFKMMFFPLNFIGFFLERFLLGTLYRKDKFITISNSTRDNLIGTGINERNIYIIPMGISQKPLEKLPQKTEFPSLICFGGIRKMKRVEDQLEAVNILRRDFPRLKFYILGRNKGSYYEFLKKKVWELRLDNFVEFVGFLPDSERDALISCSWVNLGTSVKEGWGLVVNEANALGTPTVAYNVYGFKDSIKHYKNGLLTITRTPDSIATAVKRLFLDKELYEKLQIGGLKDSKNFNFDKSAGEFEKIIYKKFDEGMEESDTEGRGGKEGVVDLSQKELVSVIIPTLNEGEFLEKCLESVKAQTYKNIEIIVVDGGSKDSTVKIVKKFGAKVFKWTKGRSAQRNRGAKIAKGKYIYFIDADVVLDKTIIYSAVREMKEKGVDMVAVHYTSDPTKGYWARIRKFEKDFLKYDKCNISPRFLFKKTFEAVGGFEEDMIAGEDYDIYNRLLKEGNTLGFITEQETHLGEPKDLKDIVNKHYFYGKTLTGRKEKNRKSKLAALTFVQKSPIKPAYIRKFYRFILRPDLAVGMAFYNVVRFVAAGVGYLAGKRSSDKIVDKNLQ